MSATYSSFMLIDGALADPERERLAPLIQECPPWLTPLYSGEAAGSGPLLIDTDAAIAADDSAQMMSLANACWPQLHLSLIDTVLSFAETCDHLRHFLVIRTEDRKTFSLRFGDCVAMQMLLTVLSKEQWSAMARPFLRWRVHARDGTLGTLCVPSASVETSPTPLVFSAHQLEQLDEAVAPEVLIVHIRDMRHGAQLPGSASEQHRWATEALEVWRSHGRAHDVARRWLTAAALDTRGSILRLETLPLIMSQPDQAGVREAILKEVSNFNSSTSDFVGRESLVRAAA